LGVFSKSSKIFKGGKDALRRKTVTLTERPLKENVFLADLSKGFICKMVLF
jgi:hypothetical protein